MNKYKTFARSTLSVMALVAASGLSAQEQETQVEDTPLSFGGLFKQNDGIDIDFYGSVRIGIDFVDAGVEQDGLNGRDFLSRVGVRGRWQLGDEVALTGQFEFGTRSDVVDFAQNGDLDLRIAAIGIDHERFGKLTFGSQTTVFHSFVRGSYFSDGLDTVRLSTIREDDYLRYDYSQGNFKFGAGLQLEGQDGDNFDQFQVGAEYKFDTVRLQGSYVLDNEGDLQGRQFGVRGWWDVSDKFTFSAYHHEQDDEFDFPPGTGSTGAVRLRALSGGLGDINLVPNCVGQNRTASGVYGRYNVTSKHQIHARYAVDSCEDDGDVDSVKVEYVYKPRKDVRWWVAAEQLNNDGGRVPAAVAGEDTFTYFQTGLRLDF